MGGESGLAGIGYELSLIEQAVADGVPFTGEQPGDDLTTADTVDVSDGGTDSPDSGQDASLGEATEDAADAGQDTAAADS
jgi:hypothetical protein